MAQADLQKTQADLKKTQADFQNTQAECVKVKEELAMEKKKSEEVNGVLSREEDARKKWESSQEDEWRRREAALLERERELMIAKDELGSVRTREEAVSDTLAYCTRSCNSLV